MREVFNATRCAPPDDGGEFKAAAAEAALSSPAGHALLARLDDAVTEFDEDRDRHIRMVAAVIVKARGGCA